VGDTEGNGSQHDHDCNRNEEFDQGECGRGLGPIGLRIHGFVELGFGSGWSL
jgi:hypothetical protein